jgi:hypothetical protein
MTCGFAATAPSLIIPLKKFTRQRMVAGAPLSVNQLYARYR